MISQLNQSWNINPSLFFNNTTATAYQKLISKFTLYGSLRLEKKVTESEGQISPFDFSALDSGLVSYRLNQIHTLSFNRGSNVFDVFLNWRNNANQFNQINGNEYRASNTIECKTRWTIIRSIDAIFSAARGINEYDSELFDPRDYYIDWYRLEPQINMRFGTRMRIISSYEFQDRKEIRNRGESSQWHKVKIDLNLRSSAKFSMNAACDWVTIRYNDNGNENSPIEYDILDGLRNGSNFIWRLDMTRRIVNNIDLTLSYNGRKSASNPIVHVGRVSAKATF